MGGAIGGVLSVGGSVLSTAASLLGNDRAERKYYRSMAAMSEKQAQQIEQAAKRNTEYIFQEAAAQNSQLGRDYANLLGQQKAALAANGLNSNSATVQLILKNSRLNAQLDQEMLAENMNREIYETNTQASLEALQYRTQAKQYKQASRTRSSLLGKISTVVGSLLGRN